MSFVTKKHLARRTFLRGAGVTLALPLLDSMVPAFTALAQSAAAPRLRLGFCFMPHGAVMANWTPTAEGALELSPILAPLEPFKKDVVVLSNLDPPAATNVARRQHSAPRENRPKRKRAPRRR